ncbi:sugar ABC transporter ATP-binding protein [Planosporangium flavigriseum]|nr:sugar ABC transporter ATP-binding protein [Planosporangium flavigriseum]
MTDLPPAPPDGRAPSGVLYPGGPEGHQPSSVLIDQTAPLITLRDVRMQFPGVLALAGVSLDVARGEVLALVGENGAGKSTLVSILAGLVSGYDGEVLLDGSPITAGSAKESIALVQQELSLVPEFSVAENIMLGQLPHGRLPGLYDRRKMDAEAQRVLDILGVDLPLRRPVRRLSPAQSQIVEIAKGLARQPRLLILDEPTSSLTTVEAEKLFSAISALRECGVAVLYISHKLDEVLAIADRVAVLRDGRKVTEGPSVEWTEERLIRAMVGRDLSQFYRRTPHTPGNVVLEVKALRAPGRFEDVSFVLREGEVVGMAGLVGAGRTEVAEAIFGLSPARDGEILLNGAPVRVKSPRTAIAHGMALVTEDRRQSGIVGSMATSRNVSLASLVAFSRGQLLRRSVESAEISRVASRVNLARHTLDRAIGTLSGGNQQKAVIAKWLMRTPKVLILDEPTRGIDVGAKSEIYRLVDELTAAGMAVLLISSEMPEILGMSDRVLVMRKGRLVAEFSREDATEESLMAAASDASTRNGERSW